MIKNRKGSSAIIQIIIVISTLLVLATFATPDGIKIIDKSNSIVETNDSRMIELEFVSMDDNEFHSLYKDLENSKINGWKIIPNELAKEYIDTSLDGDFAVNNMKRVKYIGEDRINELDLNNY